MTTSKSTEFILFEIISKLYEKQKAENEKLSY